MFNNVLIFIPWRLCEAAWLPDAAAKAVAAGLSRSPGAHFRAIVAAPTPRRHDGVSFDIVECRMPLFEVKRLGEAPGLN